MIQLICNTLEQSVSQLPRVAALVLAMLSVSVYADTIPSAQIAWTDGSKTVSVKPANTYTNAAIAPTAHTAFVGDLSVGAQSAMVVDAQTGKVLYGKNSDIVRSIASITKVMTAMVTVDSRLDMHEVITLEDSDFMGAKQASSNLRVGDRVNRAELLLLALMKSENPAAKALARSHPQGYQGFIKLMNAKAQSIGMTSAYFEDSSGLNPHNVSSASDLVKMVKAASEYGVIRSFSSTPEYTFDLGGRTLHARNTNAVVREGQWNIELSKTGYISEAGRCVVMQANVNNKPAYIVLMGARDSQGRTGDAKRILGWLSGLI